MSSLEPLLRPVTAMINRQIQAKTPARELCKKLSDRVMAGACQRHDASGLFGG